jgi:ParB-like chromosome segregation protein Spo0J
MAYDEHGMMDGIALGFSMEPLLVSLTNILPSKNIPKELGASRKFMQIRSSIKEIGLIEPLSITPIIRKSEHHMLLDGHMRLIALRDLGYEDAPCLVAVDDESYTYNSRINRLSTIQEHYMIRRAIERGVSTKRLAAVLNIDTSQIFKKMKLLNGIFAKTTFCRCLTDLTMEFECQNFKAQ